MPRSNAAEAMRRTCSYPGCTARVKGRFRTCRVCRLVARVKFGVWYARKRERAEHALALSASET